MTERTVYPHVRRESQKKSVTVARLELIMHDQLFNRYQHKILSKTHRYPFLLTSFRPQCARPQLFTNLRIVVNRTDD